MHVVDGADHDNGSTAAVTAINWPPCPCRKAGDEATAPQARQAWRPRPPPPPCGVGAQWEERAFGRAMA
jgi:hypothetical protein